MIDPYFETIEHITNNSKEKEYVKDRNHLTEKYQNMNKGNKTQAFNSACRIVPYPKIEVKHTSEKLM